MAFLSVGKLKKATTSQIGSEGLTIDEPEYDTPTWRLELFEVPQ
jgi:hypothetical protein